MSDSVEPQNESTVAPPPRDEVSLTAPGAPAPSRVPVPPAVELPVELAGRFKLMGTLGRGGMGVVLLVKDRRLEREVALKLMRFEDPHLAKLFQKEARISAGLEHDNCVRLYEYGELPDGAGGTRQYLVMEYVRGQSLAARLALGRPTLVEAARLAADILRGIEEAHRVDIVHRDLKPANVFLEPSGRAKVADFGLAVLTRKGGDETAGRLAGTPGYMSPEQARREAVGPASDVFAAGVILHEMLTGRRLFTGESMEAVLEATRAARPPAPSRVNPAVPAALDELVAKALAPRAQDRPDAPSLRKSLEAWLERAGTARRAAGGALPERPYKLLEHFDAADAPIFFGRQAETLELVELIEDGALGLVTMFGPCGIGKSSVLRAGLVPALDASRWEPLVLRAGADPAGLVRAALAGLAAKHLEAPPTPWELEAEPHRLDSILLELERSTGRALVLLVDQAEEVFTLNAPGSPRVADLFALVERLALSPAGRTRVVLSFRTEFRGAFFPLEERLGGRQRPYAVRNIGFAGLLEAVEGPSRQESYQFVYERGLPQRIAGDVARTANETGDAAPALLQIVCRQLYDGMKKELGRVITSQMYRAKVGGARGALRRYVEERLASPDYEHRASIARQMLKALTVKEEGGERYARGRDEDELLAFPDRAVARRTLERLISDHLVLREAGLEGRFRVRLASEVVCPLVDAWQIEPDAAERAARALERGHARWREANKSGEELLSGAPLALVEAERAQLSNLSKSEQAYVEASLARRRRRRRTAVAAAAALALVACAAGWFAFLRPGELVVESDPDGATVTEDGRTLGTTPLDVQAAPGVHALRLTSPRHDPADIEVRVPVGGRAEHRPVLRYPYGTLSLGSDPQGATATLYAGAEPVLSGLRTPFTTEVLAGTYRLALRLPGYGEAEVDPVRVGANRRLVQLSPKLARITGSLAVDAPYAGVKAVLTQRETGERLGPFSLPLPPRDLPTGPWRVEASSPTSLFDTRDVTLTRDARVQLTMWTPMVRPVWEQKLKGEVYATPAIADLDGDGALDVALPEGNELVALDGRDGAQRWRFAAGDLIWSSPVAADLDGDGAADVVFGANDNFVHAVSGKTGAELWKYDMGAHVLSSPCLVPATSGPPLIVVGSDKGAIVALDGKAGTLRWSVPTGGKVRSSPALGDLEGDGRPAIVVGSADGHLRVLEAGSGKLRWEHSAGAELNGSPALVDLDGDGKLDVVIGGKDHKVRALSSRGRLLWTADTGDEVRAGIAAGDLGRGHVDVVAASFDHKLYVLEGATGKVVWTRDLGGPLMASPVLHDLDGDGVPEVIMGARDGVLRAFSGRDGAPVLALQRAGPIAATVALGDLDSDGARDLVFASWNDKVCVLRGRTPRPVWATRVSPSDAVTPAGFTAYDLDGDGCQDVLVGDGQGELRAVSGLDGHELWHVAAGDRVSSAPAVGHVSASSAVDVVVPLADGGLRAFSGRDGARLWFAATGKHFRGVPVLVEVAEQGRSDVVIGDLDGVVRLLDGHTGKPLWEHREPGVIGHPVALVRTRKDGPRGVVAAYDGRLVCLDLEHGTPLWTAKLPGDAMAAPVACDVDHDGAPELAVVTGDGSLHVVHARDGSVAWTGKLGGVGSVAPLPLYIQRGQPPALITGAADGHVRALAADTLKPLWDVKLGGAIVAIGHAALDRPTVQEVLVASADGFARVLSGDDGRVLASVDLGSATAAVPQIAQAGPQRRDCLFEIHLGGLLVASPLTRPLVAARESRVFSFTSGSGRWSDTRTGR